MHPNIGPDYYAPYKADEELILPDYNEFVSGLVKDGCYSGVPVILTSDCSCSRNRHARQTRRPTDRQTDRQSATQYAAPS